MTPAMPPMPAAPAAAPMGGGNDDGVGSKLSGYAPPSMGPFSCSNCMHFNGSDACDNPKVIADPEVNGTVEADGCCNLFQPGTGGDNDADDTGAKPQMSDGAASLMSGAKFPKARPTNGGF